MIDLSDARDFKAEYEKHFAGLKYFAMRYVGDEELACDLLQDVFVKLWENAGKFDTEQGFIVYLYRSVRNKCLTHLRDTKRREARLSQYEGPEQEEPIINEIIEAEVYALVNDIFSELPPAAKAVYLKSLEGKSHQEIARELSIAINTIKKHKNNANRYLRERLRKIILLMSLAG